MSDYPLSRPQFERLLRLQDETDCRAVLARYGSAIDWRDGDALASVFWPDAEVDYGFFTGTGEGIVPVLLQIAAQSKRRFHMSSGERVSIEGDVAVSESYMLTQVISLDPVDMLVSKVFFGRFLDRLERRMGVWRIARRGYLHHGGFSEAYVEDVALMGVTPADELNARHPGYLRF